MAQQPLQRRDSGSPDLMNRRAEMARTRSRLSKNLSELKKRILQPFTKSEDEPMAATKSKSGKSKGKKRKSSAASSKPMKTIKRTAGKAMTKTKKVLGEMLAGAAVGAVKGAAEAVTPDEPKKGGAKNRSAQK